jgi:predicted transcriptional regulator
LYFQQAQGREIMNSILQKAAAATVVVTAVMNHLMKANILKRMKLCLK